MLHYDSLLADMATDLKANEVEEKPTSAEVCDGRRLSKRKRKTKTTTDDEKEEVVAKQLRPRKKL